MDVEDSRERTVMVNDGVESRAWRMEGPRWPFAPIKVRFFRGMVRIWGKIGGRAEGGN